MCLWLTIAPNAPHGAAHDAGGAPLSLSTHFSSQLWLLNDNELGKQADNLVCRQIRTGLGPFDDPQLQLEPGCKSSI